MYVVGFAAETHDVINYALGKLESKQADAIIMNDVSDPSIGMNSDENEVTILFKDQTEVHFERDTKAQIANNIAESLKDRVKK